MTAQARRAYSYRTAAEDYSVSVSTLRRAVADGKIRTREAGGRVLLNPEDLEREFGFAAPAEPPPAPARLSRRDERLAAEFLGR